MLDIDFSWEWRPREDPMLVIADEYSKDDDVGDLPAACKRLQQLQLLTLAQD